MTNPTTATPEQHGAGEETKALIDYTYIVWIDFGSEGWSPKPADTEEDVLDVIAELGQYGYIVTLVPGVSLTINSYRPRKS